jgi:hypothetical protein
MSGEVVAPFFECTSALPTQIVGEGTNSMLASRRVQPHAPYHPWPLAALQATKWSAKRRASEEPMAVRRSEVGTCGWLVSPGETPAPQHPNHDPPPHPEPHIAPCYCVVPDADSSSLHAVVSQRRDVWPTAGTGLDGLATT